jgi:primosomal protein N' (replication factor Y)
MMNAGRAGRAAKQGKVVIQTYNPAHNTIQQVTNTDYVGMYRSSCMTARFINILHFRIIKLTLKQRDFDKLKKVRCGCIKY